jgi:electron transport complex protein RnfB
MPDEVYRALAKRLDEIPNGFAATESGVELRLLAKLFEPAEAKLATVMRLTPERADQIGARIGVDGREAHDGLLTMGKKGLIRTSRGDDVTLFGLMPFVVGIYEDQLLRMDEEMATLFEQYFQETGGGSMTHGEPSVHRIIPVETSVPVDVEILPYERASELVEGSRSWGVRECVCRVQQKKVGKGCDSTLENCVVFAPVPGAFDESESTRAIAKDDALRILREAAEEGLVHSTCNYQNQIYYVCNCCPCCCGILRGVTEFEVPTAVARSDFRIVVDGDACTGCGACLERCHFGALSVSDEVCAADYDRCLGCGACAPACPVDALALERREEGDVPRPPANKRAWLTDRAGKRGVSLSDIL